MKRVDGDLATLVRVQRTALESVTAHLLANRSDDVVAVWRREQARAAVRFLDELEGATRPIETEAPPSIGLSARNQLRATVRSVKHGDILSSVRLEIDDDAEERFAALPDDDAGKGAYAVFAWLGWLQQTLIDALEARFK